MSAPVCAILCSESAPLCLRQVLVSNIKYPVIPSRIVISKRLAQCMHPALPSGVHLKALECYDIMFKCMGTNRLSQELFIYSAGETRANEHLLDGATNKGAFSVRECDLPVTCLFRYTLWPCDVFGYVLQLCPHRLPLWLCYRELHLVF